MKRNGPKKEEKTPNISQGRKNENRVEMVEDFFCSRVRNINVSC